MRRVPKPAKSKETKPPVARQSPKDADSRVRDLEKRLEEALRREAEGIEQQAATSEVLQVISSSPADLQPVLDAVAENATRVCSASDAVIRLLDRGALQIAAHYGPIPVGQSLPVTRGSLAGRAIMDRQAIHVEDMSEAPEDEFPEGRTSARRLKIGTALATPLLRESVPIGAIVIRRNEVRPFSEKQIRLLQTFADQAVIAIENVRLFKELQTSNRDLTTALDKQTATSDILRVISQSQTDAQPVFDAIVRAAARLCHAVLSNVQLFDGQLMHYVAGHNIGPAEMEMLRRLYPMPPNRNQTASRAILDKAVVHVPDVLEDPKYLRELAVQGGWRSVLSVPMVGKGRPIGAITVARMEPGLFSDTEIELLQTFADQAVIAIENVRLFNETKEALEQQTATGEILRVIAASPTDVQPVFDTIVESAARLCHAQFCHVLRFDGTLLHLAAHHGMSPEGVAALQSVYPLAPGRGSAAGRSILSGRIEQIPDTT